MIGTDTVTAASFIAATIASKVAENMTRNGTASKPYMPLPSEIIFVCVGLSIVVVGLLGNAFVVYVIITDRKLLHSSVNLFLLNLAIADMGNLLFCAPDLVQSTLGLGWTLPDIMCPVIRFLQEYFLYASVLLQMSIGIERFMAICSPLRMQRFTSRTTTCFLLFAWGTAALLASPFAFYMRTKRGANGEICAWVRSFSLHNKDLLSTMNFLVPYGIPLVLLTILYTIMCRRLWGRECMIANEVQQVTILRLRRSVVKMLVISMILYFICYTPMQLLSLKPMTSVPKEWRICFNLLTSASSAANPIVYIICCRHFRMRFTEMMSSIPHCCSPSAEKYQTVIADGEKSCTLGAPNATASRSPYVSFRRSTRRPNTSMAVTLL